MQEVNEIAAWTYRLGFGRFARDYTVYVIKRKRGMPPGHTTQDMAADYARAIEGALDPSHVMGFSIGGAIAQYVALDCPETKSALQSTGPLAVARSVIDARRMQESTTGGNQ